MRGAYSARPTLHHLMTVTIQMKDAGSEAYYYVIFHDYHDTATHLVFIFFEPFGRV
jgi:hypothetical protein